MQRRGITKVRNEEHIIEHTLDEWATWCPDGIHVYDDGSTDGTAEICRAHPAVVEVMTSSLWDEDRERAEWFNRDLVYRSARRFLSWGDWIACFDADEHLYDMDASLLERADCQVIRCLWYDVYITPEDEDGDYTSRRWVGPETRSIPLFFRVNPSLWGFTLPDQRIMHHGPEGTYQSGLVKHYGKGFSKELWERKVDYYSTTFGPKYADKWQARRGRAVKRDYLSDEGRPLVLWEDVRQAHRGQRTTDAPARPVPAPLH